LTQKPHKLCVHFHELSNNFSLADLKKTNLESVLESSNSLALKFIQEKQLAVRNRRLAQPRIILGDFTSNHLNEFIVQNCEKHLRFFFN
jgi:hypothetical protein